MEFGMIRIAIDGPGGAGKSSLAKAVAAKLGIIYVDTGALYRTIGLYMLKNGVDPKDAQAVISKLGAFRLELSFTDGKQVILLDGEDVGDSIRTPEISMAASAVSAIPEVRSFLLETQRSMASKNSVIMDGRDIGTVILPNAEVKIFLTASPEARARRRYEELLAKGASVTYESVYSEMAERDKNDSTRAVAPCVPADDAVMLDNSDMTPEQTVDAVLDIIKKKAKKHKKRSGYMIVRASAIPEVRSFLLETQRSMASKNSVIMDGRDIGTVILPNAEVKIFLTASPEARARRRYEELLAKGASVTYESVYSEMAERDKNDSTRAVAPCVPADDAVMLDNSDMTPEQTVDAVLDIIKKKAKKHKKRSGYMIVRAIIRPFTKFFLRIHVHGLENVPAEGPAIICSNHIAIRDVFIIAVSAKRQIRFIAKKELSRVPLLGRIIKALGAVFVDRKGADVGALRSSVELLEQGELISIFPQGHRNPGVDPAKTKIKNGAALIAYRSGADVLPAFINVKKHKYGFFRRVDLYFGELIPNSELGFVNGGKDEYEAAGKKIFSAILALNKQEPRTLEENEN